MKSDRYTCPVCKQFLSVSQNEDNYYFMFCGYGPCKSYAANDGSDGATHIEAYQKLCKAIEQEEIE